MCEHSMTSRRCDKTVSCHGGVLDVTLSRVTQSGDPSPVMRIPAHTCAYLNARSMKRRLTVSRRRRPAGKEVMLRD